MRAVLTPTAPGIRVRFVEEGNVLGEAVSRANGTAWVKLTFNSPGDHAVRAVPESTSVFEAAPVSR